MQDDESISMSSCSLQSIASGPSLFMEKSRYPHHQHPDKNQPPAHPQRKRSHVGRRPRKHHPQQHPQQPSEIDHDPEQEHDHEHGHEHGHEESQDTLGTMGPTITRTNLRSKKKGVPLTHDAIIQPFEDGRGDPIPALSPPSANTTVIINKPAAAATTRSIRSNNSSRNNAQRKPTAPHEAGGIVIHRSNSTGSSRRDDRKYFSDASSDDDYSVPSHSDFDAPNPTSDDDRVVDNVSVTDSVSTDASGPQQGRFGHATINANVNTHRPHSSSMSNHRAHISSHNTNSWHSKSSNMDKDRRMSGNTLDTIPTATPRQSSPMAARRGFSPRIVVDPDDSDYNFTGNDDMDDNNDNTRPMPERRFTTGMHTFAAAWPTQRRVMQLPQDPKQSGFGNSMRQTSHVTTERVHRFLECYYRDLNLQCDDNAEDVAQEEHGAESDVSTNDKVLVTEPSGGDGDVTTTTTASSPTDNDDDSCNGDIPDDGKTSAGDSDKEEEAVPEVAANMDANAPDEASDKAVDDGEEQLLDQDADVMIRAAAESLPRHVSTSPQQDLAEDAQDTPQADNSRSNHGNSNCSRGSGTDSIRSNNNEERRRKFEAFTSKYMKPGYCLIRPSGNPVFRDGFCDLFTGDMLMKQATLVSVDSVQILSHGRAAIAVYTTDQIFYYKDKLNEDRAVMTAVIEASSTTGVLRIAHEHRTVGQPIPKETRWSTTEG